MLGIGMLDKLNVFYSNNPKIIFDDNWFLDQNKILALKQHELCVIDLASEHYGIDGIDHVYNKLDQHNVNFLLLSHDPNDHKKFDRMFFYPHWYHWSKKHFIVDNNLASCDRTYKWGCLNGMPRAHRIYNFLYSKQQSYYESAIFSFYRLDPGVQNLNDDDLLSVDELALWKELEPSLPNQKLISGWPRADSVCNLPAITDAYIHLVTETTVKQRIFISEKTWKPIAAGQIFLIFGNVGTVDYLRKQGVDVFDDIIDHSYDWTLDWRQRLHQIHQQLAKLVSQDLKSLYVNTIQRRQANAEKFFAGDFDQQYYQTIIKCINMQN